MISIALVLIFAVAVIAIPLATDAREHAKTTAFILIGAYAARMLLMAIVTWGDVPLLQAVGGDCDTYEWSAMQVARGWVVHDSIEFTEEGALAITSASLPINTFAVLVYYNDGPCRAACTALVAGLACLTSYTLYRLAVDLGSDPKFAQRALLVQLFMPGYFVYTANMYKDGIAAFFVITVFAAAVRLATRLTLASVAAAVVSLVALYYTRIYMVVMSMIPLAVAFLGTRSSGFIRRFVVPLTIAVGLGVVAASGKAVTEFSERMESVYDRATDANVEAWNAKGGSGVTFDDGGSPFGALGPKIAYTLLSPFPWMGGSFALQVGKVDVLIWYYLCYRAVISGKRLWRDDRGVLLIILAFVVPATFVYALTMANVGLIFRQRIPIVLIGTLLAVLGWRKTKPVETASVASPSLPSPELPRDAAAAE